MKTVRGDNVVPCAAVSLRLFSGLTLGAAHGTAALTDTHGRAQTDKGPKAETLYRFTKVN